MGELTTIGWTNHTFNVAWGCWKISPGCLNCYADSQSRRYGHQVWGINAPRRTFGDKHWAEPIKWNAAAEEAGERRRVFCSSMTDVCLNDPIIIGEMKKLWPLIRATPWLDWQLLTKRPERYCMTLPHDWWDDAYPNVWLGTSIESNEYAIRADHLRQLQATVRFVSYEPALGPLDTLDLTGIDWVIYGGESGGRRRPENKDWARQMKRKCEEETLNRVRREDPAVCAFFHKQSNGPHSGIGAELDGRIVQNYPARRLELPVLPV